MSISKIRQLFSELESAYQASQQDIEEKKAALSDIDRQREDLKIKEAALFKKEEELKQSEIRVDRKLKLSLSSDEAQKMRDSALGLMEDAKKLERQSIRRLEEIGVREEDVLSREQKLARKVIDYKQKLKEELVSRFVGNLS